MIEILIHVLVLFAVLAVLFWIVKLGVEHFGAPPVLVQIVGLVFVLIFLLGALRAFGIVAGGPWRLP